MKQNVTFERVEQLCWTLKEILCNHYVEPIISTTIRRNSFSEFTDYRDCSWVESAVFSFFLLFLLGVTHMVCTYSG